MQQLLHACSAITASQPGRRPRGPHAFMQKQHQHTVHTACCMHDVRPFICLYLLGMHYLCLHYCSYHRLAELALATLVLTVRFRLLHPEFLIMVRWCSSTVPPAGLATATHIEPSEGMSCTHVSRLQPTCLILGPPMFLAVPVMMIEIVASVLYNSNRSFCCSFKLSFCSNVIHDMDQENIFDYE